jgi:hypothetical protein
MRRVALAAAALFLVSLVPLLPGATAQGVGQGSVWDFEFHVPEGEQVLESGFQRHFVLTVTDRSRDGPAGLDPSLPTTTPAFHYVDFVVTPLLEDTKGWYVDPLVGFQIVAGQTKTSALGIRVDPEAQNPYYAASVTATFRTDGGESNKTATMLFFSPGIRGFNVRPGGSLELGPDSLQTTSLIITNAYNNPHTFTIDLTGNPCGILVGPPASVVVAERSSLEVPFSVQGPRDRFWFNSLDCSLGFQTSALESGHSVQTSIGVTINGFYVDPQWVINAVAILLLLLLLLFLLARRKARVEEEILGKPQKPWTIPVEVLYLKALRQKDVRAWYVVRHYLMEDEYRSSLLWYKSYKKQTKGSRKKESLVLRQEKAYEAWKRAWAKDIAKPIRKADRFDAKLQRKLDRKAGKVHRKQLAKYGSVRGQMEKAHAKKVERASAQYEKAAAKARKKGQPVPAKPVVPKPDYPDEPELVPIALAEHKWAKKSARFRARMVRKQGDLEVKFEKADARRLRKVRRRVQKLARKLDDPEFVAEHPLLQGS